MPRPPPSVWRVAAAGVALLAYALLSHLLMVHYAARPWAVAVLFGPLWAAIAAAAWRRRHMGTLVACAAVVALVLVVVARGGVSDIRLMYVLQHGGIHAALAWGFGITLRRGGTPLLSAMAHRVHGRSIPEIATYTRRLTALWVAYFLGMIATSLMLYAFAPWAWWSLFCNLFTPLSAAALFAGEILWRGLRHPEFERVSLRRMMQACRAQGPEVPAR